MEAFSRNGMQFTVSDRGPQDAETVVLLHGFPQSAQSWAGVSRPLLAAGYRVIAPDQRGYTAQARPRRRRAYRLNELVADVVALVDAAGVDRVHLVGHDIAIGRRAAELTSRWVTGPFDFTVLDGVSHWIPEQAPDVLATHILERIRSVSPHCDTTSG